MNIVFMGTPDFAVKPLLKLFSNKNIKILAVVCNPDKPVGRKQVLTPPPVKITAEGLGLTVLQYSKIRVEGVEKLKELNPDLIVTCAFGQILSQEIIDIPKFGILNIHGSLLPKYRGASPIQSAILNGEKYTGITIMKTDIGIDTGDILLQEKTEIMPEETAGELFDRLSEMGAKLINKAIEKIESGNAEYVKQGDDASYSKMIKKEDALLDFNQTAEKVYNKIRAFNPSPVTFATYKGEIIKFYNAKLSNGKGKVGEVINSTKYLEIACKSGSVIITSLQKSGGKRLDVKDFLLGARINDGDIFNL